MEKNGKAQSIIRRLAAAIARGSETTRLCAAAIARGSETTRLCAAAAWIAPMLLLAQPGVSIAQESRVVVLELFTSQGCFSCPPADRLVNQLGRTGHLNSKIIPLAFHVDYWDRLGWQDPFSNFRWTNRQRIYAQHFNLESLYTPQVVVNGKSQGLGSSEKTVMTLIEQAMETAPAVQIHLSIDPLAPTDRKIRVTIQAQLLETVPGPDLRVMVAILENGFTTRILAGENAGWILQNDYVVRKLEPTFSVPSQAGSAVEESVTFNLSPIWKSGNLAVAAFLQNLNTFEIHGGALEAVQIRRKSGAPTDSPANDLWRTVEAP